MKTKSILIAAVMFLALSVAANAAIFQIGSEPRTTVVQSGLTERIGDITFYAPVDGLPVVTGTITVIFPGTVTVTPACGSIVGPAGISVTNIGTNTLTITVGAQASLPVSFTLRGVRVAVAGTGLTSLSASLTATGNSINVGQTSNIPVISAIAAGIQSVTATGAPTWYVVGQAATSTTVNLSVREGFIDAFGEAANAPVNSQNVGTIVTLKVSSIPTGVTLQFPLHDSGNYFTRTDAVGADATLPVTLSASASDQFVYYEVTGTLPVIAPVDDMIIPITASISGTSVVKVVTIAATFSPIGGTLIPRYIEAYSTAVTVVTVRDNTTTLLIPYATDKAEAAATGFETAIAIANSTTGPANSITQFGTTTAQAGTITFYFYPTSGTASTYTTAAGSPGVGLNASGQLESGRTYLVMLDQLLDLVATPYTGEFNGYIFIVTNFTNAHGEYFVTDWEGFTHGSLIPVISNQRTVNPDFIPGF